MCIASRDHKHDDVQLARRLGMARQLQPLPWGTVRGHTGLQPFLVDGIQCHCVPLVLQESARRVEGELGLFEYVYVSESAVVGELPCNDVN